MTELRAHIFTGGLRRDICLIKRNPRRDRDDPMTMVAGSFGFNGRPTRLAGHIGVPKSLLEKELQCDGKSLKDQKLSPCLGVWLFGPFQWLTCFPFAVRTQAALPDE
jgi:hypothetical protein